MWLCFTSYLIRNTCQADLRRVEIGLLLQEQLRSISRKDEGVPQCRTVVQIAHRCCRGQSLYHFQTNQLLDLLVRAPRLVLPPSHHGHHWMGHFLPATSPAHEFVIFNTRLNLWEEKCRETQALRRLSRMF